jgi:ABC-type multidrug transport system ATPase subunit
MVDNTILQIENLSIKRADRRLFDDFSLCMPEGSRFLLDAPSGTGKTTLLRSVLGLESVDRGRITVAGCPMDRRHIKTIRRTTAYISQGVELPMEKVGDLFETVLSFEGNRHIRYNRRDLPHRLEEWKLPRNAVDAPFTDLSGGERQRVGLALLELLDRPLWILDEPTAALDTETARLAVNRILGDPRRSVLVASHDPAWREAEKKGSVVGITTPFLPGNTP